MAMHFLNRLNGILLFAALVLSATPTAIPHPLNIPQMLKRAESATAKKFPEANLVLVDDFVHSVYQANGTYKTWDDMAYKILTPKGRDQLKTLSTYYSASYGKSAILLLEIYKADGTVERPPLQKLLKEMSDPGQMRSNIYDPNHKIITASVPKLQVGDTVRYCVYREVFKSRCPNTYSDIFVLESSDPILNFDILIDGPQALPLKKIAVRDPVPNTMTSWQKKTEDGRIHYGWKIQNVPVMIPEPRMPSPYTVSQRLLVSTIPAWEDVSRWYWNLCQPRMTPSPEMKDKVQALIKGKTDQLDKIQSIFKFVSQEIRYVGITMEDDAPGYEPHDVSVTFSNRHGVCRDKAALLVALLRLADIKAFPVLIMAGEKIDQEVCQPYFNHAITAALKEDGSYILMDSTDENTRDLFPSYLADKSFLVARKEGETLQTSPFSPAQDNLVLIDTAGTLDDKGTLDATSTLKFNGINDNAYRGFFAQSSPEDQKDFMHRIVNAVAPGATISELAIRPQNMLDTGTPLSITIRFTAKDQFTGNHTVAMLDPPYLSKVIGMHNMVLKATQLDTRKYPYVTKLAAGARETIRLKISPSWGAPRQLPAVVNLDDRLMTWKQQAAFSQGQLTVTTQTAVNQIRFTPDEYLTLKKHIKTIHDNSRKRFIFFKPKTPAAGNSQGHDAEITSQDISFNLSDAATWTQTTAATVKILSYKGKKENSELLIPFNPSYQKINLDLAQVTSIGKDPSGKPLTQTKQIDRKDIKIMDQRWVSGAPRYPAGKICVIPLPGVEVGSVIQYKYTLTTNGLPFFNLQDSFRDIGMPIRHKSITVNTPAQLKLTTAVFQSGTLASSFNTHQNNISETFVTENNRTIWTWTATDQPAIPEEPQQAPVMTFAPTVFAAAAPWSEHFSLLTQNLKAKAVPGKLIRKLAAELQELPRDSRPYAAKEGKSQLQAINETLNLALRPAGPSFLALPLSTLSPAETTLAEGYGHDADRAIVAYTLLKELGYQPEFIFASGTDYPQALFQQLYSTPSTGLFTELLVRVKHQGETYWFNDQNQYADIRTTSVEHHCAMTEQGQLFTIVPPELYQTSSHTYIRLKLDDAGNATLDCSTPITGTSFTSQHKYISRLTPELKRRMHLSLVRSFSPRALPTSKLTADFHAYPGTLAFTCQIPHFATLDGNYLYFTLPIHAFRRLAFHVNEERQTPMARFLNTTQQTTFTIQLPPSFKKTAMLPLDYQWQDETRNLSFKASVSQKANGEITLVYKASCSPVIVTEQQFPSFRKLDDVLSHDAINTILLTK